MDHVLNYRRDGLDGSTALGDLLGRWGDVYGTGHEIVFVLLSPAGETNKTYPAV